MGPPWPAKKSASDEGVVSSYRRRRLMRFHRHGVFPLRLGFGLAALLTSAACQPNPTVFRGDPQFAGGPRGCAAKCEADGLQMTGFVYSGAFATSCVCGPTVPPSAAARSTPAADAPAAELPESDPLARRGPSDAAGVGAQAAVEGANSAQVATEAAAIAAEASRQQQQLLQRRKP